MTITIKDLKEGSPCHVSRNYIQRGAPQPATVKKIGRTLIHVDCNGAQLSFLLATGRMKDDSSSFLIPYLAGHQERLKVCRAYNHIKQYMRLGDAPEGVTIEDLKRVATLLKIDLPPALLESA